MTLPLIEAVPALGSAIGLPTAAPPTSSGITGVIEQFASQFSTGTTAVLASIDTAALDIIKVAYLTCLIVGLLLYFTHIGRRLGKDLIIGGVLLFALGTFLIPALPGA
jgi:hypothetical protein